MGGHNIINDYIAGAVGGSAGLIVGHPFDTTKVQLQTRQTSSAYKSTWDAIKHINQAGLTKGFFRGLGFPLVTYGAINSVFFGVYGSTLRFIQGSDLKRKTTHSDTFFAGCCGGFFQLFIACPVDVVKVVLQSQIDKTTGSTIGVKSAGHNQYFTGPVECFATLYKTGGIRRCHKGCFIQLLRDIPASGIYFVSYETMFSYSMDHNISDRHGIFGHLMAGGLAGVISWSAVTPFDVIKSQTQADYTGSLSRNSLEAARTIYQKSGLRGFYRGWLMICCRAFPVNAVTFLVYSKTGIFLNQLW